MNPIMALSSPGPVRCNACDWLDPGAVCAELTGDPEAVCDRQTWVCRAEWLSGCQTARTGPGARAENALRLQAEEDNDAERLKLLPAVNCGPLWPDALFL